MFVNVERAVDVSQAIRADGWSFPSAATGKPVVPAEHVYELSQSTQTQVQFGGTSTPSADIADVHASVGKGIAYWFPICDNTYDVVNPNDTRAVIEEAYRTLYEAGLWLDHYPDPLAG